MTPTTFEEWREAELMKNNVYYYVDIYVDGKWTHDGEYDFNEPLFFDADAEARWAGQCSGKPFRIVKVHQVDIQALWTYHVVEENGVKQNRRITL